MLRLPVHIWSKEMKSNFIYYQVYLQGTPLCENVGQEIDQIL